MIENLKLKKTVFAVLTLLTIMASAQAQTSSCNVTGNQTAETNCINPANGLLEIKNANIYVPTGFYGVSGATSLNTPFTINVENSTFKTVNPTYLYSGNLYGNAVGSGVLNLNLTGNNKFEATGSGNDSAIYLKANNTVTMSVTGTTKIDNINSSNPGIYAESVSESVIINHNGDGYVNVNGGGNAINAKAAKDVYIGIGSSNMPITTDSNGSHGIFANAGGNSTVENNSAITTQADNSHAIFTQAAWSGRNDVANNGTLTLNGTNSTAMAVYANTGAISVQSNGQIIGNKNNSTTGISVTGTGSTSDTATIVSNASITATRGIVAETTGHHINVTANNTIDTNSVGISALTASGNTWISQESGTITASGNGAVGILAKSTGSNTSSVGVRVSGTVNAQNYSNGTAISASSNAGNIDIENLGTLNAALGIYTTSTDGIVNVQNQGTINAVGGAGVLVANAKQATVANRVGGQINSQVIGLDLAGKENTLFNYGDITAPIAILGHTGDMTVNQISGTITGDIVFGSGENVYLATGGKVDGRVLMDDGNATATITGTFDSTDLTLLDGGANGINHLTLDTDFTGHSIASAPIANSVELTHWDNITIASGRKFTQAAETLFDGSRVSTLHLESGAVWKMADDLTAVKIDGHVENSGEISFSSPTTRALPPVGRTVQITGNYTGNDGLITLNTVLGTDSSLTDKVVIDGNATGTTKLQINNLGGAGNYTYGSGIEVVQVGGTSDAGAFSLAAPVSSGVYEYVLATENQNWYLQNTYNASNSPSFPGANGGGWGGKLLNPNTGTYFGNQYAAQNMFNTDIFDNANTLNKPNQWLWVRFQTNDMKTDMLKGLQKTDINTTVIQLGADILKTESVTAGVYTGYGQSSIKNTSNQTGTKGSGKVDGYNLGFYGRFKPVDSGFFLNGWAYYGWYKNTLGGDAQLRDSKYNSHMYSVNAQTGYDFALGSSGWILQPNVKLAYSNITSKNLVDSHLTQYTDGKSSGFQTALGVKLYGQEGDTFRPSIQLNWLHNSAENSVKLNQTSQNTQIAKNAFELRLGTEGQLTKKINAWGSMGLQSGNQSYRNYDLRLGMAYQF